MTMVLLNQIKAQEEGHALKGGTIPTIGIIPFGIPEKS